MNNIIRFTILISLIILFLGCEPNPEFYIDGKPCYTVSYCIKSHTETKYEFHFGYNEFSGTYESHYGKHDVDICDVYKIDTIEIKK